MEKLVTLIIPAYNIERYLDDCIKSVIVQTYKNLQILIVNDGSTDNTRNIIEKYAKIDSRVTLLDKPNGGLSDARNYGMKHIEGDYFLFLDGDDVIDNKTVEILVKMIEDTESNIAICGYEKFVSNYTIDNYDSNLNKIENCKEFYERILCLNQNTYAWGTLIKSKYKDSFKFPVGKYFEDLGSMYRLYFAAGKIVTNPIKLFKYRQVPTSIIHTFNPKKPIDYLEHTKEMCDYINEQYSELAPLIQQYICNSYTSAIYMCIGNNKGMVKEYKNELKRVIKGLKINMHSREIRIKLKLFKISVSLGVFVLKLKKRFCI